jgi:hypothetical protein
MSTPSTPHQTIHSPSQWPSETKFVAVRIGQVKEPLTPFGIAWWRVWSITGRNHARIESVNVGMVEDDAPPPRPLSLGRLLDQIEKAGSSPKACKRSAVTAMNDLKSQHAVESDGASHIVRGQRDGTDALNHSGAASFFIFRQCTHRVIDFPLSMPRPPAAMTKRHAMHR